jgi:hypothetical protein
VQLEPVAVEDVSVNDLVAFEDVTGLEGRRLVAVQDKAVALERA